MFQPTTPRAGRRRPTAAAVAAALILVPVTTAQAVPAAQAPAAAPAAVAATSPSASAKPDLVSILRGYDAIWTSDGKADLRGTVVNKKIVARNDAATVKINHSAKYDFTQQQRAAADAEYDMSITMADGLGSKLGPIYADAVANGKLPLTHALVVGFTGSVSGSVPTADAKNHFSSPRPFVPRPDITPSRLPVHRYADANGTLTAYNGLTTSGSFPSGHATDAYAIGVTLATLLPGLAPGILARTSEAANNRIVLGVHYPLDIIGGRIAGTVAVAARWSDAEFANTQLEPARAELVSVLEKACGHSLAYCIEHEHPYTNAPSKVTGTRTGEQVYERRLTYGFPKTGAKGVAAVVPASAVGLLKTAFPKLTEAQRRTVLATTELPSGYPLDVSGTDGGWQRIDLLAALTAKVKVGRSGTVTVTSSVTALR